MSRAPRATALPAPALITRQAELESLCEALADAEVISVDTESNSMHAHQERVCLVQLSAHGRDYLVDPLAVDIHPLGDAFADPGTEKILHAAEYDVMCLRRDYGFEFSNLFDTMIAARILGWRRLGLGSILSEMFDVTPNKRMQRHDWGRRPLSPAAIDYARLDTHFLESLRAHLHAQLLAGDHIDEARSAFGRVAQAEATPKVWDPDGYWRLQGARDLDPEGAAVLAALFRFREHLARRLDRPLFKVAGDTVLVTMARERPRDRGQLAKIKGMPQGLVRRHGGSMLDAIRTALAGDPPTRPPRARRPKKTPANRRFERLRAWRKQVADARGVETDVILGKRTLEQIAEADPSDAGQLEATGALDAWQLGRYGAELLRVLAESTENGD